MSKPRVNDEALRRHIEILNDMIEQRPAPGSLIMRRDVAVDLLDARAQIATLEREAEIQVNYDNDNLTALREILGTRDLRNVREGIQQVREMVADARRYRAIRDGRWELVYGKAKRAVLFDHPALKQIAISNKSYDLDAAVDAAIEAAKKEGNG